MHSYTEIALASWPRRAIFESFQEFECPCYSLTVKVEAHKLQTFAKKTQESFFLLALYALLRAANAVPQLRQRIINNTIVEFSAIDAISPILGPHELFYHAWCGYQPEFASFHAQCAPKLALAQQGIEQYDPVRHDFLCASCVPWLHFDALSPAHSTFHQTMPLLTWGKIQQGYIPISIKVHHGFVDGLHIGRFFEGVHQGFSQPESLYEAMPVQPAPCTAGQHRQ